MRNYSLIILLAATAVGFGASTQRAFADRDSRYRMVPLVSDIPGVAQITDPLLVNPWGVTLGPTTPFWVSNQGTHTSTLYGGDVNGSPFTKNPLVVAIPGGPPTGVVFNSTPDFVVSSGSSSAASRFIFSTLAGSIVGWNPAVPPPPPATSGVLATSVAGAVYTGLGTGTNSSGNFLFAANVAQGRIDVLNATFGLSVAPGGFVNPTLPAGYSPFNIQNLGGHLFVAYTNPALGDLEGNGLVSEFDTNGNFMRNVAWGDELNQPWGMQIAPSTFGSFGGALIVGNFGDGRIHAFDLSRRKNLGALKMERGGQIRIERLWALQFGNGVGGGDRNAMYFSAGIGQEQHGLFGKIVVDASGH